MLLNLNTKDDFDELKIKVKLTENDMENHANNNKRISNYNQCKYLIKTRVPNLISILEDVKNNKNSTHFLVLLI